MSWGAENDRAHTEDYHRLRKEAEASQLVKQGGRKGVIARLRQARQQRHAERLATKDLARRNLKDYKPPTGDEGGPSGLGGF